jgi:alanyl-tRNA synthetase
MSQRTWTAAEIRKTFVDFFTERGHRHVRSSALIPGNDPTLFFTNSGMVQFKDVFVGERVTEYSRATTVQRCLRVSGKHNDLENVGRTARHHTFFEMLGNFSFGDYFKRDAIHWAWELLTAVYGLPADKLHVSVHPEDDEAYAMWRDEVKVPEARIHRDPQNFWSMGDTGPCGPCSEIHIDLGPSMSAGVVDVPYGDPRGEHRYLELWNLVFMQFDRSADGTLTPLPRPSIDTGAGLERLTAVLQGKFNNYDTDLFLPVIDLVAKRAGVTYLTAPETDVALRVIADHSRAAAQLIADGIYPDNEGRGYVLRRVMRRAIRFGRMLGLDAPFLIDTTAVVIDMLGDVHPELVEARETIHRIVLQEETRFGRTIRAGLRLLDEEVEKIASENKKQLPGDVAFVLYDTHGFPLDLTALILEEKGLTLDHAGFEAAMEEQRTRARAASKFGREDISAYQALVEGGFGGTRFTGYESTSEQSSIAALFADGARIPMAAPGQRVAIVTPLSPFYAESGGQVGDTGRIEALDGSFVVLVDDTLKPFGDVVAHHGIVERGTVREGAAVALHIDAAKRDDTRKNHSATHLMHDALRKVLGGHVRQRGSLVSPNRLRFDFSHTGPMTSEEIRRVEALVNAHVIANEPVTTEVMAYDAAIERGAIAFFDEKYGDDVRVLAVGSESVELCGGTHVSRTGDIGLFLIASEGPISSGVRRIEAVTGMEAVRYAMKRDAQVKEVAERLRVAPDLVGERLDRILDEKRALENELADTRIAWRKAEARAAVRAARSYGAHRFAAVRMDGVAGKDLRPLADALKSDLSSGALLLVSTADDKVSLLVWVSPELRDAFPAGRIVGELAALVGGKGGGKNDVAQAGGTEIGRIDEVERTFYARAEAIAGA